MSGVIKRKTGKTATPNKKTKVSTKKSAKSKGSPRKQQTHVSDEDSDTFDAVGFDAVMEDDEGEEMFGDLMQNDKSKPSKTKLAREENSDLDENVDDAEDFDDMLEEETPDEKRLRLAKSYLEDLAIQLEKEKVDRDDVADEDEDTNELLGKRLAQDLSRKRGKYFDELAGTTRFGTVRRRRRTHAATVTSVTLTEDDQYAFSASKDCSVAQWDVETGTCIARVIGSKTKKVSRDKFQGHVGPVLTVSVSDDGTYLASAGVDKQVKIWDLRENLTRVIHSFKGHRDTITNVKFKPNSHELFSTSLDLQVKVWSADELAPLTTLWGHQSSVCGLDGLGYKDGCITSGSDGSVRLWNVTKQSQLVFKMPTKTSLYGTDCVDTVSLITDDRWATGDNSGSLSLWSSSHKKPVFTQKQAHGPLRPNTAVSNNHSQAQILEKYQNSEVIGETLDDDYTFKSDPCWISALAACRNSDLLLSGSRDGYVKMWQIDKECKSLTQVDALEQPGFINSIAVSKRGRCCVIATGQEHWLGRWSKVPQAKNCVIFASLTQS